MDHVVISELENNPQAAALMHRISEPLGLSEMAINYYELEEGDSFSFAYHSHEFQEEVFYIREGTATFETDSGSITVESGELIHFLPGEFQRGWNYDEERVVALAIGAPPRRGEQVTLRFCEVCGERSDNTLTDEFVDEEPVRVAYCITCGAETGRWHQGSMPGEVP